MKLVFVFLLFSLFILISQPFVLMIVNTVLNLEKSDKIPEDSLIYKFCKWIKKESVIGITSIIFTFLSMFLAIGFFATADIIAIYNEKDYDLDAMAMDLALLSKEDDNYRIDFREYKNDDGEKEIKVLYYKGLGYYEIRCYGIKSINMDNGVLKDISEKYKKD